ncbi:MAG: DUF503 domain-containing protein [Anaerofustis sp.]
MDVGVVKLKIRIPWSHSLKERRSEIRSLSSKLKNRFSVSVSEVEISDVHQIAFLGISFVASDSRTAESLMSHLIEFAENETDAEVVVLHSELLRY